MAENATQEYIELLEETRRFSIVRVVWVDSRFDSGWQDVADVESLDLGEMVTVGLLLDHGPHSVTVTLTRDVLADTVYGAITIPLAVVTELSVLVIEEG